MKAGAVVALWLVATSWVWTTQQGIYEDHKVMHAAQASAAPSLWQARGLMRWSIWQQARFAPSPLAMRVVNLALSGLVIGLVALLAFRLGLPVWLGAAVMACHPLTVETIAMLSGRAELIAAIGVLLACVAATWRTAWRWLVMPLGLGLGWLGKETAVVGVALVPLLLRRPWLTMGATVALLVAAWDWRYAGVATSAPPQPMLDWLLLQSAAVMRLVSQGIVPVGLTPDADIDAISRGLQVASLASLMALTIVGMRMWRQRPLVAIGLLWIMIVVAPRLFVQTPRSYLNAHHFYLALPGVALLVSASVNHRRSFYAKAESCAA